jgi:Zinc carboxypeptidase
MHRRAPAALLAVTLALLIGPAAASAAQDYLRPFEAVVDRGGAAELAAAGVDLEHAGYDPAKSYEQTLAVVLTKSDANRLERRGVSLEAVELPTLAPKALRETGGDSPNPYYDVYRQFMEPGGIHDEMVQLAADNRDVVKYERIGTSTLGKPMSVLKVTNNARNVPDGTRPAVLYSSNNHAREWIAAEVERRLMRWVIEHKNDPRIADLLSRTELWFMPIQNPDGYDYTFTCGVGAANHLCGPNETPSNRFWRKTLRDNDGDGIYGEPSQSGQGDGVDPNRNYPAKRAIDEEGATNQTGGETYRGPYALSEPENLAFDRLLRKIDFKANVNYHSAGQLLLTPVSYITDYAPVDATIFNAMTGTDGDGAVEPYQPQRSSDLYESNGDTIDNGYMNYGVIGWTPELDTCATGGGPAGCNQFAFPDDEEKVEAVFQKNLPMALNIAHSSAQLDRPRNFDNDPGQYQIKPTHDIQPTRFDVSYGATQQIEANVRRSLGPVDVTAEISGPGGADRTVTAIRAEEVPPGERYGDAPGQYYKRVRATTPVNFASPTQTPRPATAGDTVDVTIRAGGLRQRFSYRVQAVPDAVPEGGTAKQRVLVLAAEDYSGVSPNREPGYDVAPRYLQQHVDALTAAGYEVETYDVDAPPLGAEGTATTRNPSFLGVLSHFDAVLWYSGDDFIPQDATETDARHLATATAQAGSMRLASWAHKTMLALRDYLNEGGKAVVDGRNIHQWPIGNTSLSATGPYQWAPDKLPGFFYPENNGGDDDLPGTAFQRYRGISNDTWQNYLGAVGRGTGSGYGQSTYNGQPIEPVAGSIFAGVGPITVDSGSGNDPNQDANGVPAPRAKSPTRLRNWSGISVQEPLRQEKIELDVTTPQTQAGGFALSTADTVTFGFGLEQVGTDTRNALVARAMQHLLPTTADTTAPTPVAFKWPAADGFVSTPRDPVEVDVTAADARGDLKEVRLLADGELVGRHATFPFQFRYVPQAADVGRAIVLTAEAEDSAGNVAAATRTIEVVSGPAVVEAPLPAVAPAIQGDPIVGRTLTCLNRGFVNGPTSYRYEWLRNSAVIAGAAAVNYTPTQADLGRQVRCRITAINSAGDGDATSDFVVISPAPQGAPAPSPGPQGLAVIVACKRSASMKALTCTTTPVGDRSVRVKSSVRLVGRRAVATRTARGRVSVRLRTGSRIRRGQRVIVRVSVGDANARLKMRVGARKRVSLAH